MSTSKSLHATVVKYTNIVKQAKVELKKMLDHLKQLKGKEKIAKTTGKKATKTSKKSSKKLAKKKPSKKTKKSSKKK